MRKPLSRPLVHTVSLGLVASTMFGAVFLNSSAGNASPGPRNGAPEAPVAIESTQVAQATASTPSVRNAPMPTTCKRALLVMSRAKVDASRFYEDDRLVIGDWVIAVRQSYWRGQHLKDPVLPTVYHSSAWLIPDTQAGVSQAIDMMVEQAQRNPDPGADAGKTALGERGWKESNVTKRMTTAACLYEWAATPSDAARMVPVIEQLAQANMDEDRYYGPPKRHPHNHGVFADQELARAGQLLGRSEWVSIAEERSRQQLAGTFDTCGMIFEQASSYQRVQANLWDAVAKWSEDPAFAATVAEMATKAREMVSALTRPDGIMEVIGNGNQIEDTPLPIPSANSPATTRWCPNSGWLTVLSNSGKYTQHAVARFGPGMKLHGHADRGATTWWVGVSGGEGVPVLSDRGIYGKIRDKRFDYQKGSAAHSTLQWTGASAAMTGTMSKDTRGTVARFSSDHKDTKWNRSLTYSNSSPTLTVKDSLRGSEANGPIRQRFTLAPGWAPTETPGQAKTREGWFVQITCMADSKKVTPKFIRVEHFPAVGKMTTAWSVDCGVPAKGGRSSIDLSATLEVQKR